MSQPITQDEINAIVWRACDTFRGTVDPSEYKNYILVMLFVKYISDVWHDHRAQYERQYADNPERIERAMNREPFKLPKGSDFASLYDKRNAPNLGEEINMALEAIEEANKEKLEGVFRNIDFNSEAALGKTAQRNERLKTLLGDFNNARLDLRPSQVGNRDIIGNAYEYMIGRFASDAGKKAGEFYTPPEVSELLATLLDPQPGERISDPACGSGSLLIKCAQKVGGENFSIWGQENNGSTWALCMMNMMLHSMPVTINNIKWGDTLRDPQLLEDDHLKRFNVVVANPPFSLDKWGDDKAKNDPFNRFWRGIPPKSKGDYAFISHMIETTYRDAEQNGRVGVIVPHGVLFRGSSEGKIRQQLIDENLLDAVIGLPANLFYGTGIPAAIMIFKRNKSDDSVMFIDASRDFEPGTNQNKLRPMHLERIVNAYRNRQSIERYATLILRNQIVENDYNLNVSRYVDVFEAENAIDLKAVQAHINDLETKLADVKTRMARYLKELGLSDE
jgi:type I restriction enzyme M protein